MAAFYVDPPRAPYWPSQHWHTSTPEEQGMDSAMLAGALEFARATDLPLHSVTVIRDGLLVLDAFLGFPQFWNKNDLCSIAHKSFNVVYSFMLSRVCKPLLLL